MARAAQPQSPSPLAATGAVSGSSAVYAPPEPHYLPLAAREHHFNTIAGHDAVKRMLWKMVAAGRLPNALLFRGPEGVGKRSLAFALAKLINGEPGDASDAQPSRAARNIASGDYLDLRVIAPGGPARQIRIEDIRDVTDWAYVTPIEARKKIILICEADRMNVASANCFLKTLEEPPPHCLTLLTTARPHALLATIRSRCAPVMLHPLANRELVAWLKACYKMDDEQASIAALLGEGRPGHAVAQLVQIEGGADAGEETDLWEAVARGPQEEAYGIDAQTRAAVATLIDRFYEHGFAATFGVASELLALAGNLAAALTLLLMWYRDLALSATTDGDLSLAVNRDLLAAGRAPHTPGDAATLGRSIKAILDAMPDTARPAFSFNAQLALENLLLRLGEIQRGAA